MKRKWIIALIVTSICLIFLFVHTIRSSEQRKHIRPFLIVIDPGHGGKDQGASRDTIYEEDINFQVALYLKNLLEMQDVTVIMTRTMDVDLASNQSKNRKREDLQQRVIIMEDADVFVSIHMNISLDTSVKGSQVFFGKGNEESEKLANTITTELKKLNQSKFEPKIGNYYILNETTTTGVLIECGFLSNEEEREKLTKSKYQEKIAYAICVGIMEYIK